MHGEIGYNLCLIYSLSWLKERLKLLGLRRRRCDINHDVLKCLISRLMASSEKLKDYRALWKHLRDKYRVFVSRYSNVSITINYSLIIACRDTVIKILREVNPVGVSLRAKKQFKRRIYTHKVL